MQILKWFLIALVALALLVIAAGQMGLFGGRMPGNLGVRDGRLKPPAKTPNSVSSQASLWSDHVQRGAAQIDPLPLRGDGPATIAALKAIIESMPGAVIVEARADYVYAQFSTRWLRFVDDTEFWFDPAAQVVQVRSASRVGKSDLGLNRQRIETIRARLAAN